MNNRSKSKLLPDRLVNEIAADISVVSSPVTDLTLNLEVLSTSSDHLKVARRKLSLSILDTSCSTLSTPSHVKIPQITCATTTHSYNSSNSDLRSVRRCSSCMDSCSSGNSCCSGSSSSYLTQTSIDNGFHSETSCSSRNISPQVEDSPFLLATDYSLPATDERMTTSIRRLHSLPLPFRGFEPTPSPIYGSTVDSRSGIRVLSRMCKSDTAALTEIISPDYGHNVLGSITAADRQISDEDKENIGSSSSLASSLLKFAIKKPIRDRALVDSTNRRLRGVCRSLSLVEQSSNRDKNKNFPAHASFYPTDRQHSEDGGFVDGGINESSSSSNGEPTSSCPRSLRALFFSPVLETSISEDVSPFASDARADSTSNSLLCSGSASVSHTISPCGLFRTPSAPAFSKLLAGARRIGAALRKDCEDRQRLRFKRSESEREELSTPVQNKRRKGACGNGAVDDKILGESENQEQQQTGRKMQRCHSEAELMIKKALSWADNANDLIGDFSKAYCLPLVAGKHQDLKSISCETLAKLIQNAYDNVVEKCVIIDSRYPYEFDGGHIKGAKNLYLKDDIMQEFFRSEQHQSSSSSSSSSSRRTVYIFHCEFSSQRGPELSRFVRNKDRDLHRDSYPHLDYPELYILDGGYKAFYEQYSQLCTPQDYVPMVHENHLEDLKHFRAKCNSWVSEKGKGFFRSNSSN